LNRDLTVAAIACQASGPLSEPNQFDGIDAASSG
jgi:hypothetical protein